MPGREGVVRVPRLCARRGSAAPVRLGAVAVPPRAAGAGALPAAGGVHRVRSPCRGTVSQPRAAYRGGITFAGADVSVFESGMGDRIAGLRLRRALTQEELAARADASVDVVRKLEQGQRRSARLATINALARALDTEPSFLVGQPSTFEGAHAVEADPPSVFALRQAVSPLSDLLGGETDPEDPPTIADLRRSLASTEVIRRGGRMGEIGALLPQLIRDARAAVHACTGAEAAAAQSVLAVAYQVAATTLAALGKEDAAYTAMDARGQRYATATTPTWRPWPRRRCPGCSPSRGALRTPNASR